MINQVRSFTLSEFNQDFNNIMAYGKNKPVKIVDGDGKLLAWISKPAPFSPAICVGKKKGVGVENNYHETYIEVSVGNFSGTLLSRDANDYQKIEVNAKCVLEDLELNRS